MYRHVTFPAAHELIAIVLYVMKRCIQDKRSTVVKVLRSAVKFYYDHSGLVHTNSLDNLPMS